MSEQMDAACDAHTYWHLESVEGCVQIVIGTFAQAPAAGPGKAGKNLKVSEQEAHVLRHVLHECRIAVLSTVHTGDAATCAHELFDVKPGVGCGALGRDAFRKSSLNERTYSLDLGCPL